jgi:hypothetical protein
MNLRLFKYLSAFLLVFGLSASLYAESDIHQPKKALYKKNAAVQYYKLNINKISTWIYGDGTSDIHNSKAAFIYPKGSNKAPFFQSGFVYGGIVNGDKKDIRVGGDTYNAGLSLGAYDGALSGDALNKASRMWRVRRDVTPSTSGVIDFSSELNDAGESTSASDIKDDYLYCWNNWPAEYGAPYTDVGSVDANGNAIKDANGNNVPDGKYDPRIDIPGFPGADQTIWYVDNDKDDDVSKSLYGSIGFGFELHTTIWGYASTGSLGNMIFRSYKLINKKQNNINDFYVCMWSDPDNGDGSDDLSGCDTTLGLGFNYNGNANDATYGLVPPAAGFDFFQGPSIKTGNPSDSAIVDIAAKRVKKGYTNLNMTAFFYFINGDAAYNDPDLGKYQTGTLKMYNLLQGLIGATGQPFVDPNTNLPTKFPLSGDPILGTGFLDGKLFPAGDRRLGMSSGPFNMAPGDTQEVVVAQMAAGAENSIDRLSAVKLLKFYDKQAQQVYSNFFNVPEAPKAPVVSVSELDKVIVLNWGQIEDDYKITENFDKKGFKFQGYNVWQMPSVSSSLSESKLLATYDIVDGIKTIFNKEFDVSSGEIIDAVAQVGKDSGLKRYIVIDKDKLRSDRPLVNGTKYYFAVTSYAYNSDSRAIPNYAENPLVALQSPSNNTPGIVPQGATPGTTIYGFADSTVASGIKHETGIADVTLIAKAVEPSKLVNSNYKVGFYTKPNTFAGSSTDEPVLSANYSLSLNEDTLSYSFTVEHPDSLSGPITSAFIGTKGLGTSLASLPFKYVTVNGKNQVQASGTLTIKNNTLSKTIVDSILAEQTAVFVATAKNPTGEAYVPLTISTYPWYLEKDGKKVLVFQQNYSLDENYKIVDHIMVKVGGVTFAAPKTYNSAKATVQGKTSSITLLGDGTYWSYKDGKAATWYLKGGDKTTHNDFVQDLEFRFTGVRAVSPTNNQDTIIVSGGSIATIRSRSNAAAVKRIRIPFEVWEPERNRQINLAIFDRNVDGKAPWGDNTTPKYFRMTGREYLIPIATDYNADTAAATANSVDYSNISPNSTWIMAFAPATKWNVGDKFLVHYQNDVQPGIDTYTFSTAAPTYTNAKAKEDVEKINIFPNPYYGVNPREINKYQRFVTISHLPTKATIRIFDLAGQLVRTYQKESVDPFQRWDLNNENGLPVASGLYIVYIDMPELSKTKVLKVSIIQEQQILDRF